MGRPHKVIVNGVGKMVCGYAVRFQKHMVYIVFRKLQRSFYKVGKLYLILNGALGVKTEHPRLALIKSGFNVLHGSVTPQRPFAVIAEVCLFRLLPFVHGGKLVLGAEAGISLALRNKLFGVYMVNIAALTLSVRTVIAAVSVYRGALVKADAVMGKRFYKHFNRSRHFSFCVSILNTEIQHAAALMTKSFTCNALDKISQMDKARGTRRHSGHYCAFLQLSLRKALFKRFRGIAYIGKQQFSQSITVGIHLFNIPFR